MRVVLDTNAVASALLWGGTPQRLIEAADEAGLELFTSEALIAELARHPPTRQARATELLPR